MNALTEKWKEIIGQLEVLKTYYDRLTERERHIVLASIIGGILFLLALIYIIFLSATASLSSKVESVRKDLRKIKELEIEFHETEKQVRDIEQTMRMTSPDFQLATELEKIAKKYRIVIESISNKPGQPSELYRETQANLTVKSVNIRALTSFLMTLKTPPTS